MLSIELLKSVDDEHAINALRADFDPLINTPLEAFLLDWIERCYEDDAAGDEDAELIDATDKHNLDAADIDKLGEALIGDAPNSAALLDVLAEEGIDSPDQLREALAVVKKFEEIAKDAGDVLDRLNTLITETQEV